MLDYSLEAQSYAESLIVPLSAGMSETNRAELFEKLKVGAAWYLKGKEVVQKVFLSNILTPFKTELKPFLYNIYESGCYRTREIPVDDIQLSDYYTLNFRIGDLLREGSYKTVANDISFLMRVLKEDCYERLYNSFAKEYGNVDFQRIAWNNRSVVLTYNTQEDVFSDLETGLIKYNMAFYYTSGDNFQMFFDENDYVALLIRLNFIIE